MAKRSKKADTQTDLSDTFLWNWKVLGDGTEAKREHRGIVKRYGRKNKPVLTNHRFDIAFPVERVYIELEGGTRSRGRHVRGNGYHNDCLKYNLAQLQGWLQLRYTSEALANDPQSVVNEVKELLRIRRTFPYTARGQLWTAEQSNYSDRRA
jgi:very-short-patch-repair endonuclease